MMTLEWQDEYTVGVKELDDQHRSLLTMINKLLVEQGEIYNAAKFPKALSALIHYAYTHFATEERHLLQVHFPSLEEHIKEHIEFIMKTVGFALRIENNGDELRNELLHYLKGWYSHHVLGTDRTYISYLSPKKNM
jgi:hemerythrin-like metal-binding protein